jgi:hypothetical protein
MADRTVLIVPGTPPMAEFAALMQAAAAMFPGLSMAHVGQTADGFVLTVPEGRHADRRWMWHLLADQRHEELAEMLGLSEAEAADALEHLAGLLDDGDGDDG